MDQGIKTIAQISNIVFCVGNSLWNVHVEEIKYWVHKHVIYIYCGCEICIQRDVPIKKGMKKVNNKSEKCHLVTQFNYELTHYWFILCIYINYNQETIYICIKEQQKSEKKEMMMRKFTLWMWPNTFENDDMICVHAQKHH